MLLDGNMPSLNRLAMPQQPCGLGAELLQNDLALSFLDVELLQS